uniref:Uncharacterized protein n=1 Tax=Triticum urartu TaxID=4572 RepID=A0A8R7P1H8_TRIUA
MPRRCVALIAVATDLPTASQGAQEDRRHRPLRLRGHVRARSTYIDCIEPPLSAGPDPVRRRRVAPSVHLDSLRLPRPHHELATSRLPTNPSSTTVLMTPPSCQSNQASPPFDHQ